MSAYRIFGAHEGIGGLGAIEAVLDDLWANPSRPDNPQEIEELIEELMALIPQEDVTHGQWRQVVTNAQNAGMSAIYALRTKLSGKPQEAVWAARVAYEALDNLVINTEGIDTNNPGEEARVLSHPLVQAELDRQWRDLEDLASSARGTGEVIERVRERAKADASVFWSS
jgi:Protein of unknown function (DUF416)